MDALYLGLNPHDIEIHFLKSSLPRRVPLSQWSSPYHLAKPILNLSLHPHLPIIFSTEPQERNHSVAGFPFPRARMPFAIKPRFPTLTIGTLAMLELSEVRGLEFERADRANLV